MFRGSAKTTLIEYLFLYIGTYGKMPKFGKVTIAIYVSDSVENGVKNMRQNLEFRWENSDFLKKYIPRVRFTDIRYEFENTEGNIFVVKAYGAKTGVRGVKERGVRPNLAILDDLISDEDARSEVIIKSVEDTVYKAVTYALHPKNRKIVWNGTPFNSKDPLHKAIESGAWRSNVYPVCEKYPCEREEFRGAWEDRFDYDYVKDQYESKLMTGNIGAFNQEMMLRIMSDDDRLVSDNDIVWYNRDLVLKNRGNFNFFITTDFATEDKQSNDFNVIFVWAYSNNNDLLLIDLIVKRQLIDKTFNNLFDMVSIHKPAEVGLERNGQQGGFITLLQQEMLRRNIFFNIACDRKNNEMGLRRVTNKVQYFNQMVPLFKMKKIWFPVELKLDPQMIEVMEEIRLASPSDFKSKKDDCLDAISMLSLMRLYGPSVEAPKATTRHGDVFHEYVAPVDNLSMNSYIV